MIEVTLRFSITAEDGEPVEMDQYTLAAEMAEAAIRNRLMGEGFLPADLLVDHYTTTFDAFA